jgi:hypothetical protein
VKSSRAVLAVLLLSSLGAAAQDSADAGAPSLVPMAAPAAAEGVDAGVPAAAPAIPEAVAKVLSLFRVYGTFKPTVAASSAAVESFSQPNLSAVTAAGNPVFSNAPGNARLSFQMAQSRLGFWFGEGSPYRAQFEFDFIDFAKASPTVAALPRLRIGKVEWSPIPALTLMAGQDWGLEQPVNPHGINLVGGGFQAGNTAFMRQQVKLLGKLGDFELGAAVGLQNNNNTAKDGLVEQSFSPTVAVRAQHSLGGRGKVGLSAIVTSLLLRAGAEPQRALAGLVGVFGDLNFGPRFNLRFEGYLAQNGANLFLLSLGQGRAAAGADPVNLREGGAFISAKVGVAGPVSVFGTFGGAGVLNPEDVAPSYTYPGMVDPANPPAFSTATLVGNGPGMTFNLHSRLGLEVKLGKGLSFMAEGFWYRSRFALLAVDVPRTGSVAQAFGSELGFLWMF